MWAGQSRVYGGTKGKLKSRLMHNRGKVDRNAEQAGGREGVNARRLVRQEEQQSMVNGIAQHRVVGRTSA